MIAYSYLCRMQGKNRYYWLLLIPVSFLAWYLFASSAKRPVRLLPYYGPRQYSDSVHLVPSFAFTDQNGHKLTDRDLDGKIYVAEFFFTTCQSICPIMNNYLSDIYKKFSGEKDVEFLSFTVDPETDSVPALKSYADRHGVVDDRWHFLTGEAKDIYRLARKGYLLDDGGKNEDEFVHTQKFALVDKGKRIRGFYDGTDSLEMVKLEQDIKLLLQEYAYDKK
jgi:protein SCO1/2